ncbi:TPA: hypothetical protein ACJKJ1_004620 [Escherichia coli]|nr:hypothetical protein [Escherichia coli]
MCHRVIAMYAQSVVTHIQHRSHMPGAFATAAALTLLPTRFSACDYLDLCVYCLSMMMMMLAMICRSGSASFASW